MIKAELMQMKLKFLKCMNVNPVGLCDECFHFGSNFHKQDKSVYISCNSEQRYLFEFTINASNFQELFF